MIEGNGIYAALGYAGIGAGVGSIGAALVAARAGRGESRGRATELITEAAAHMSEQQTAIIDRLQVRVDKQAHAIIALTSVLDELLPTFNLDTVREAQLRKVVNAARLTV